MPSVGYKRLSSSGDTVQTKSRQTTDRHATHKQTIKSQSNTHPVPIAKYKKVLGEGGTKYSLHPTHIANKDCRLRTATLPPTIVSALANKSSWSCELWSEWPALGRTVRIAGCVPWMVVREWHSTYNNVADCLPRWAGGSPGQSTRALAGWEAGSKNPKQSKTKHRGFNSVSFLSLWRRIIIQEIYTVPTLWLKALKECWWPIKP